MAISLEAVLELPPEEMLKHDEHMTEAELRNHKQVYFEDVSVGMEIPKYINQFTEVHTFRWCAAMENSHRIHLDAPFAINHDKLPGRLFNGSWRHALINSWLKDYVRPDGWAWKAGWQVRAMVVPREITIMWGKVTDKKVVEGMGIVDLQIGIKNQDGIEGCPGTATVVLPLRGGKAIPYPFVPPKL